MTTGLASSILGGGGGLPVGAVITSAVAPPGDSWLLCDNSKQLKATYPLYAAQYPTGCGTFINTVRTPPVVPSSNACASNGTIWAIARNAGTIAIQTTPDGVTYTNRTTPDADVRSILWLGGTNWVAQSGAGASNAPMYSTNNAVTWSSSTGMTTAAPTATQNCMTWAPTLGTVGRLCAVKGDSNAFTSDDLGITWTTRPAGAIMHNVCWTGSQFVATTNSTTGVRVSPDGITWAEVKLPWPLSAATAVTSFIASDGNGRVVISNNPSFHSSLGVAISQDHGATWVMRTLPGYIWIASSGSTVFQPQFISYSNGRFLLPGVAGLAISVDLQTWALVADTAFVNANSWSNVVHRSAGVYYSASGVANNATLVEDTSKMYLPGQVTAYAGSGIHNALGQPQYVKVK